MKVRLHESRRRDRCPESPAPRRSTLISRGLGLALTAALIAAAQPTALAMPLSTVPAGVQGGIPLEPNPLRFHLTTPMHQERAHHGATLLADGRVLVVGGEAGYFLASAEVFDPAAGRWQLTGPVNSFHVSPAVVRLADGRVLVAGGTGSGSSSPVAEVYDPATDAWSLVSEMATGRAAHTATPLPDGRVLVVGGTSGGGPLATAEIFDPATATWSPAPSMGEARAGHTATALRDGRVLVAGGYGLDYVALQSYEIFNPRTARWSAVKAMNFAHRAHSAARLVDGRVLVTGGEDRTGYSAATELFDPATNAWTVAGPLRRGDSGGQLVALPNDTALYVGGAGDNSLFDPKTKTWSYSLPIGGVAYHAAVLLADGRVLVSGGRTGLPVLNSVWITESPIGPGAGVCVVGDASGDTFSQVTNPASPLYGWWFYRMAATGEEISGKASSLTYRPGRLLSAVDQDYGVDNRFYFMSASVDFARGTAIVRVRRVDGATELRLVDRYLGDDPPCR